MAYVPQYIPTDTNVLQSTLNQYQQSYDTQTAKAQGMSESMASVPTSSAYDETAKSELLSGFSKDVDALDKQFNFDRSNSQYAQRLAALTTKYRGHPLWSLIGDKAKISDMRTKLMAEMGANYHENVNPLDATLKDRSPLDSWRPQNTQELYNTVAAEAMDWAKSHPREPVMKEIRPGLMHIVSQDGFRSVPNAQEFLAGEEGHAFLTKSIIASGFDPKDPAIYNKAYSAAIAHLVGEKKEQFENYNYKYAEGNITGGRGLVDAGTQPTYGKYSISNIANATDLKKQIEDAQKESEDTSLKPEQKAAAKAKLLDLNDQVSKISAVVQDEHSQNPTNITMGKNLVSQFLQTSPSFKKLKDEDRNVMVEKEFNELINTLNSGPHRGLLDKILKGPDRLLARSYSVGKDFVAPEDQEAMNAVLAKYGNRKIDDKALFQFYEWYKGRGAYTTTGYQPVKDAINDRLSQGEEVNATVAVPNIATDPKERKAATTYLADNLRFLLPMENTYWHGSDSQRWDDTKLAQVEESLRNADSKVEYIFNPEGGSLARVTVQNKTTKKLDIVTLKLTPDAMNSLTGLTRDPRFLSYMTSGFNFATGKDYTIGDERLLNTLKNITGDNDKTINSAFKDLHFIKYVDKNTKEIKYKISIPEYDKLLNQQYPNGIGSKQEAIEVLGRIYMLKRGIPNKQS
jgi:hypothetical protein